MLCETVNHVKLADPRVSKMNRHHPNMRVRFHYLSTAAAPVPFFPIRLPTSRERISFM